MRWYEREGRDERERRDEREVRDEREERDERERGDERRWRGMGGGMRGRGEMRVMRETRVMKKTCNRQDVTLEVDLSRQREAVVDDWLLVITVPAVQFHTPAARKQVGHVSMGLITGVNIQGEYTGVNRSDHRGEYTGGVHRGEWELS